MSEVVIVSAISLFLIALLQDIQWKRILETIEVLVLFLSMLLQEFNLN